MRTDAAGADRSSEPGPERLEGLPRRFFGAVALDLPWLMKTNSAEKPERNPRRHYRCMPLDEIEALPVGELAAEHSWILLWIPGPFLARGVHVRLFKRWDFRPSSIGFTWTKTTSTGKEFMGLGYTTRQNPEFVVIGRRGHPPRANADVRAQITAPVREHSRKPDEFYQRAEALVGWRTPKVELFARQGRFGWWSWGDQVDLFPAEARAAA